MSNITSAPKVIIDDLVYQKIMYFVDKSDIEVSGLGKIVFDKDGNIRVVDAMLLPQKNTATTTDILPEDVGKAMFLMKDTEGELKFWWHSHVNMGVFWSGTDHDTIVKLASGGWFVSTVFNKKRQMKTCIAMSQPFHGIIDDVDTSVSRTLDNSLIKEWDKEYEEKVTNNIQPLKVVHPPIWSGIRGIGFNQSTPSIGAEPGYSWGHLGFDSFDADHDFNSMSLGKKVESTSVHSMTQEDVKNALKARDALEERLSEVEDELDVFVQMGLLTEEERISDKFNDDSLLSHLKGSRKGI